ncbi:MAG: hypothetical protein M3Z28_01940 [Candidatus Dormibacteraeota bacterium]|nr:hypothetical protein [Candidatus Dormibacteraeota bacterium]
MGSAVAMRGGPLRALLRLVMYLVLACILTLVGRVAYASQGVTALPVTTLMAASAVDQLRSDLEAIATGSGARVDISLQELSGPRRNGSTSRSVKISWLLSSLRRSHRCRV